MEGPVGICRPDSSFEAFSGTVVFGAPRDSVSTATSRFWHVPYHMDITVEQWDIAGACDGAPLSCFFNQPPTITFTESHDSVLEVGHDAGYPANLVLRDGRAQYAWYTADTIPVGLYDSIGAVALPSVPGLHELRKQ